jgi:hypothetical protein
VKECPHCRLENPDSAEHCDCGYNFATGSMRSSGEVSIFDYDHPKEKGPTDYTGLIITAILAPVFALLAFFANAEVGLTAIIVLGMITCAIKIRWNLRKHVWFWATIVFILALHVPLFFIVRWPQGKGPTIAYTMPIGFADFFIILGALRLAEKLFSKDSSIPLRRRWPRLPVIRRYPAPLRLPSQRPTQDAVDLAKLVQVVCRFQADEPLDRLPSAYLMDPVALHPVCARDGLQQSQVALAQRPKDPAARLASCCA